MIRSHDVCGRIARGAGSFKSYCYAAALPGDARLGSPDLVYILDWAHGIYIVPVQSMPTLD